MTDGVSITAPGEDAVEQEDRPMIDPETGWNRLMVELVARSIHVAHEINPNSWLLDHTHGGILLKVGFVNILIIRSSGAHEVVLSKDAIDLNDVESISGVDVDPSKAHVSRPWALFLEVSSKSLEEVLERFHAAQTEAVERSASGVKTRLQGWDRHKTELRDEIERIVGTSIPQPGYTHEVEYLQTQPNSDLSGSMYNQPMAQQMAQSILAAHKLGTACWSVFETAKRIALNVGQETVGGSSVSGMYDFVVDRGMLESEQLDRLKAHKKPKQSNTYRSLMFLRLPDDGQTDYLADLQNAHVSALRTLTAVHKKATLWNDHREDFRKQVEEMAGVALPIPSYVTVEPPNLLGTIKTLFASEGLHYTDAQIATFYTALQTKGFVVLSGISGTGKSKIAQSFVNILPDKDIPPEEVVAEREQLIPRVVQTTTINSALVNFPRKLIERYPLPEPGTKTYVMVTFDGLSQACAFNTIVQDNSAVYRLYFSGELRQRITSLDLGTMLYFRPTIDNDMARLTGFDIELSKDVASTHRSDVTGSVKESNHLFLSVRPDWRDSTSLLGYFNPLTQTYEWTDFLSFILRAAESYRARDGLAWFVTLDEMNLAHVEYYFADLLSVIESGRRTDVADTLAGFTREPLRTTYPDTLDDEVPPREIFLPPNLYIIGTVNMDETTHAFSPKVLDRAFTIELTDVSFRDYPPVTPMNGAGSLTESDKQSLLAAFTRDGRFHGIDKDEVAQAVAGHPEIRDWLGSLNHLLMKDRFHFGYRIFDEICQYVANNDLNGMMAFDDAFDQAVFMKVLPKFSGSRARLRSPLINVLAWAIDPVLPLPKEVVTDLDTHLAGTSEALMTSVQGAAVPRVARRALDMLERVELDGFVSFG